jgi:hypothetical protein
VLSIISGSAKRGAMSRYNRRQLAIAGLGLAGGRLRRETTSEMRHSWRTGGGSDAHATLAAVVNSMSTPVDGKATQRLHKGLSRGGIQ